MKSKEDRSMLAVRYAMVSLAHVMSEIERNPDHPDREMLLNVIDVRKADLLTALLKLGHSESEAGYIVENVAVDAQQGAKELLSTMSNDQLASSPQADDTVQFIRQAIKRERV